MSVVAARRFQHAFGRSIQTKILDAVWNHREAGVNIRQVSRIVRQSYVYTTLAVAGLARRGLVLKERRGVDVYVRPNLKNPVMKWIAKM